MTHSKGNTLYYQPDSWRELANKIPPHPETGLDWLRSEELREAKVSWPVWCSTERKYCVRLPWDRNVTRTCWFGPPSAAASCDGFLFDASEKMKRRKMKRRKGDDRSSHSLDERFCSLQAYLWTSWNTLFWADQRLLSFLCFSSGAWQAASLEWHCCDSCTAPSQLHLAIPALVVPLGKELKSFAMHL